MAGVVGHRPRDVQGLVSARCVDAARRARREHQHCHSTSLLACAPAMLLVVSLGSTRRRRPCPVQHPDGARHGPRRAQDNGPHETPDVEQIRQQTAPTTNVRHASGLQPSSSEMAYNHSDIQQGEDELVTWAGFVDSRYSDGVGAAFSEL
eukprot:3940089-Rhodomonas_salina.6